MPLHTATCPTVTKYKQNAHPGDSFTGRGYIKICANDASALLIWMDGYSAKTFSKLCSKCKPDTARTVDTVAAKNALLEAEVRKLMAAPAKLQQQLANTPREPPSFYYALTKVFKRNPAVVAAALLRAQGTCEKCRAQAPFLRASSQEPYLEVHHKVRLTDGGIDHPDNVLALCPNCHREAHFG